MVYCRKSFVKVNSVKKEAKTKTPSKVSNNKNNHSNNATTEPDDATLVEACLAGDERAWEILIQRYSRLIYTVPLRFGLPQTVADEIFQETCITLLEKLHTIQNPSRLSAWLVTVSRRCCIQRWRGKKPPETVDIMDIDHPTEDKVEEKMVRVEQQYLVHEAIKNLNERCQRLLTMLFLDESSPSYEDISNELGISLGSIGPNRARCLKKLQKEIAKLEDSI